MGLANPSNTTPHSLPGSDQPYQHHTTQSPGSDQPYQYHSTQSTRVWPALPVPHHTVYQGLANPSNTTPHSLPGSGQPYQNHTTQSTRVWPTLPIPHHIAYQGLASPTSTTAHSLPGFGQPQQYHTTQSTRVWPTLPVPQHTVTGSARPARNTHQTLVCRNWTTLHIDACTLKTPAQGSWYSRQKRVQITRVCNIDISQLRLTM